LGVSITLLSPPALGVLAGVFRASFLFGVLVSFGVLASCFGVLLSGLGVLISGLAALGVLFSDLGVLGSALGVLTLASACLDLGVLSPAPLILG